MTASNRPIRCDADPSLRNELQPHQLAAAADPHIPIRALARKTGRRLPGQPEHDA